MPKEDGKKMNLYQKLAKIRKSVEVIQKDKSGYGYRYVSEPEILSKLTAMMDKMGILLMPSIPQTHGDKYDNKIFDVDPEPIWTSKKNKKTGEIEEERKWEVIVSGPMIFSWINIDDPSERLDVPWVFVGQQADASQAFGSGLTYCNRYFLLKFFNIATVEDDPDNWRSKQAQAAKEEDTLITKGIIEEVDRLSKQYVADAKNANDAKNRKAKLLEISSQFVKGGNYTKINEPALAAKLLTEIQKLAGMKEDK